MNMKTANEYMQIPYRDILTSQEHALIGSGIFQFEPEMVKNAFKPRGLFHGVSREEIDTLRRDQEAISSPSAMFFYDGVPDDAMWTMVFKLSDLDSEGNVIKKEPQLMGIDKGDGVLIVDPEELAKYSLSGEGRKGLFLPEGFRHDVEGKR